LHTLNLHKLWVLGLNAAEEMRNTVQNAHLEKKAMYNHESI
jgi:hypothetical protein